MLKIDEIQTTEHLSKTALVTFCSLLAVCKKIDSFSQSLTMLALGLGLISSWWNNSSLLTIFCTIIFLTGLLGKYYALRLYFDKKLFDYLANHLDQMPTTLLELDRALVNLNLIKAHPQEQRTLADRQYGTMQLLKRQVVLLIIQLLLLIVMLLTGIFLH